MRGFVRLSVGVSVCLLVHQSIGPSVMIELKSGKTNFFLNFSVWLSVLLRWIGVVGPCPPVCNHVVTLPSFFFSLPLPICTRLVPHAQPWIWPFFNNNCYVIGRQNPFIQNKAGYTATEVACGWAGAIFEVTRPFGQEQWGQRNKIIKKVKCDGPTYQPTNRPTDGQSGL